jgi:hypothetical protein
MKIEQLKKMKDQRPFRPFSLRMADGKEIRITHPDAIAWGSEDSRTVTCISEKDDWNVIELALITSLGTQAPAMPSGLVKGNGD